MGFDFCFSNWKRMEFASRTGGGQAMEYGIGPGEGGGEMMGFRKET